MTGQKARDAGLATGEHLEAFGESSLPQNVRHFFAGQADGMGVYAKEMRLPAGTLIVTHEHSYDHMSVLASGTVMLTVDGVSEELHGPAVVGIAKGKPHGIRAVTDAVWFCIHPTETIDPAEVDAAILKGPV